MIYGDIARRGWEFTKGGGLEIGKCKGRKKNPLYVLGLLNWAIKEGTVGLGLSHPVYIISINVAVSNRMGKGNKCHNVVVGREGSELHMSCQHL